MPIKYVPYFPDTIQGQAILNNFVRTQRALKYRDNDQPAQHILRGLPLYDLQTVETVGANPEGNLLIRGECIAACAYLKDKSIMVDLVYIDPPFASGADYAKTIFVRRNPKVAEAIAKAEEEMEDAELQAFEEKMYGDIWNKEAYLNWMYENLLAIKSVMSETGSIYVHLDWHIGHYVKVLMDEVFGEDNFVNEIVWGYKDIGAKAVPYFKKKHDTIFFYQRSDERVFNIKRQGLSKSTLERYGTYFDENGHITYKWLKENNPGVFKKLKGIPDDLDQSWLDKNSGQPFSDWWDDISPLKSHFDEAVDYSTQKPEALLKRIIEASSKAGMTVADFFGGSGVTAKVAHDLERKYIHVDVGVNSIQTARDRLVAAGASFKIFDVQDGVALFRNPVQTMDKLKNLIPGMGAIIGLSNLWAGAIFGTREGMMPVYLPDLKDHTQRILDTPLMNRLLQEELPELPENVKKVIVYYVDVENLSEMEKFIADVNGTTIEVELRDLKQVLYNVVANDVVEYQLGEVEGKYTIEFTKFISDRLIQKIDAYNQKKQLNNGQAEQLQTPEVAEEDEVSTEENEVTEESDNEEVKPARPFKPIEISENGLELIELVSLDCTSSEGIWHSDGETKIDKRGYVILNGKKTKKFWDAKITSEKKPLRMKVRNIAGDETIVIL